MDIENKLNLKVLSKIGFNNEFEIESFLDDLINLYKIDNNGKNTIFYFLGNFENQFLTYFKNALKSKSLKCDLKDGYNLTNYDMYKNIFFIAGVNVTTFSQIDKLNNNLILKEVKPHGVIILDKYL